MLVREMEGVIGQLLEADRFRDYCPNGLQVEGRAEIRKLVGGVSASLAFLQAAAKTGADAVLVHHGYFWKGEDARVVGVKKTRLDFLLRNDLSLLAYHLPLDAHPTLGNNAQLAPLLGATISGRFGDQMIAAHGTLNMPRTVTAWTAHLAQTLGRAPLIIGDPGKLLNRVAWCSGGAQGYFGEAIGLGVDAFLTGEISEQHYHLAQESGVAFVCAGHHATERYGVQALGRHLAETCGIEFEYVEVENPV